VLLVNDAQPGTLKIVIEFIGSIGNIYYFADGILPAPPFGDEPKQKKVQPESLSKR
jgi:hypothetical protein